MDIDTIINKTPAPILRGIAERVKERRLELNLTQRAFASRAGMGYDAFRKFESTGEISLHNLVLCAIALDDVDGFLDLFTKKSYQNMEELLRIQKMKNRQRGTRND